MESWRSQSGVLEDAHGNRQAAEGRSLTESTDAGGRPQALPSPVMPRSFTYRRRDLLRAAAVLATLGFVARARPARADDEDPPPEPQLEGEPPPPASEPPPYAALDGTPLAPEDAAWLNARHPLAVMIDNLPGDARPQWGLDRADLVYELLVEGGITRFMAVFHRQEADRIGPVRSVRTPYLWLVSEIDAVLAHVGAADTTGATDAASQMRMWSIRRLEEVTAPAVFWRDRSRPAPHNAVTSTFDLRAAAEEWGWPGPAAVAPWLYKDDHEALNLPTAAPARITYGFAVGDLPAQAPFWVDWRYDAGPNAYRRLMGGASHRDGITGVPLTARNVIVQFDSAEIINHEGHVLYASMGEGPAYIFLDGEMIEGVWTKRWREDRTRFWNPNGEEVRFNRGNTWVSVLPYGSPFGWE